MARKPTRTAADYLPDRTSLTALREAAASCQGCDLYRDATQTVFGAGDPNARVVLVGEQPGDVEDRRGEPFVGPAGGVLDQAMAEAGIDRAGTYVTNAVKHFKFVPAERGKRRLHKTPGRTEIVACRPWLSAELAAVRPELLVCLGATASKAVFGPAFKLTERRGVLLPPPEEELMAGESEAGDHVPSAILATIHPSAVLRALDRDEAYAGLVADLRVAAEALS